MANKTSTALIETLGSFSPISLEELNSSMSLMDRRNVKYLVHIDQLAQIIKDLQQDFYVLKIQDKSIFSYDNVYMDTKDYHLYTQHANSQKPRTKIRTRNYVDADNLAFIEYKQTEKKVQRKFRYNYGVANHGKMTNSAMRFIEGIWQSLYGATPPHLFFPSIKTNYKRFTLCSKNNDERITIDFDINLIEARHANQKKQSHTLKNLAIIESKSTKTNCVSHEIMKLHNIPVAGSCSKYGL